MPAVDMALSYPGKVYAYLYDHLNAFSPWNHMKHEFNIKSMDNCEYQESLSIKYESSFVSFAVKETFFLNLQLLGLGIVTISLVYSVHRILKCHHCHQLIRKYQIKWSRI